MDNVEALLHEWVIKNLKRNVFTNFWWQIKPEFVSEALKATGVSSSDYQKLRTAKEANISLPTYSE